MMDFPRYSLDTEDFKNHAVKAAYQKSQHKMPEEAALTS